MIQQTLPPIEDESSVDLHVLPSVTKTFSTSGHWFLCTLSVATMEIPNGIFSTGAENTAPVVVPQMCYTAFVFLEKYFQKSPMNL